MRTKTAWEVVDDGNGKKVPQKIGLKPEQREGMEYEFTLVLDLAIDGHIATSSKDRTSLFDGRHFKPTAATGEELAAWLGTGRDPQEISLELFERLKLAAAEIQNPVHLTNWGRKHKPDFDRLLPADNKKLVEFCQKRQEEFKKPVEHSEEKQEVLQ